MIRYSIYKLDLISPSELSGDSNYALFKGYPTYFNEIHIHESIDNVVNDLKIRGSIFKAKEQVFAFNFPDPNNMLIQDNEYTGVISKLDNPDEISYIMKKFTEEVVVEDRGPYTI